MTKYVPMDVSKSWLFFVLSMIIYVSTSTDLQIISEKIKLYINHPDVRILTGMASCQVDKSEKYLPLDIPSDPVASSRSTAMMPQFDLNNRGVYRELHDTLDVSIFR